MAIFECISHLPMGLQMIFNFTFEIFQEMSNFMVLIIFKEFFIELEVHTM